jgi:cob(I)alamin adenosyltransferase
MPKFYTSSGDDGYTGVIGSGRVPKYHPRPDAVGTIDESTAALGFARAHSQIERNINLVIAIQRDLYHIMSEIASTQENAERFRIIDDKRVAWLEAQIDAIADEVDVPSEFILPGDSSAGAAFSLARSIVRRAERKVANLIHNEDITNPELLRYLNRLSSLCFVLELSENQASGSDTLTVSNI